MERELKGQKYEGYITTVSRQAAAAGRREPYYLTYLREHGGPRRKAAGKDMGKETVEYGQDCM